MKASMKRVIIFGRNSAPKKSCKMPHPKYPRAEKLPANEAVNPFKKFGCTKNRRNFGKALK